MRNVIHHMRIKRRRRNFSILKNKNTARTSILLPLKYKMLFYAGGMLFTVFSYLAGAWAFGNKSALQGPGAFLQFSIQFINTHTLLFILWLIVCLGVSVFTCNLFQKEYSSRIIAERLANTDGLSGLYNHVYFQKRLEQEIHRASRHGRNISLIMLDLDNFKLFNDTWGHQAGDQLLKWFSSVLLTSTRDHDIVSRYGGEEFVVMLPETKCSDALLVAERIVDATQRLSASSLGKERRVTVSAGVSSFPAHGSSNYTLIMSADTALYRAKSEGKNRAVEYMLDTNEQDATNDAQPGKLTNSVGKSEVLRYMAAIVDSRNGYNEHHSDNVEGYALLLGKALDLPIEELENLRTTAILHDLGSICIPKAILAKTGPLTDYEWSVIREHVMVTTAILDIAGQPKSIMPGIRYHHERYDGNGYPDALSGEDIPLPARIIAIADAYESMTSPRPYRKQMSSKNALNEIQRCAGTQFDPKLCEVFISITRDSATQKQRDYTLSSK